MTLLVRVINGFKWQSLLREWLRLPTMYVCTATQICCYRGQADIESWKRGVKTSFENRKYIFGKVLAVKVFKLFPLNAWSNALTLLSKTLRDYSRPTAGKVNNDCKAYFVSGTYDCPSVLSVFIFEHRMHSMALHICKDYAKAKSNRKEAKVVKSTSCPEVLS